jgi:WD40 repeat protein
MCGPALSQPRLFLLSSSGTTHLGVACAGAALFTVGVVLLPQSRLEMGVIGAEETNPPRKTMALPGRGHPVFAMSFHSVEGLLAWYYVEKAVRSWDLERQALVWEHGVDDAEICFAADSEFFASRVTGQVRVHRVRDGRPIVVVGTGLQSIHALALSPSGHRIAIAGAEPGIKDISGFFEETVEVFALPTNRLIARFRRILGNITHVSIDESGELLVVGTTNLRPERRAGVYMWNVQSHEGGLVALEDRSGISCSAFSDDGKLVVVGLGFKNGEGGVIYDVESRRRIAELKNDVYSVRSVVFLPGLYEFVSGGPCVYHWRLEKTRSEWKVDLISDRLFGKEKIIDLSTNRVVCRSKSRELLAVSNARGDIEVYSLKK